MAIDRAEQCRQWNADRGHQRRAGQARAQDFTHEHQAYAGLCSFTAFSTRLRAATGERQLFPVDAARYVAPADIRLIGQALPAPLQSINHTVWSRGIGWGVEYWLLPPDAAPTLPAGSLFADDDIPPHEWEDYTLGWLVCATCWRAAICPLCQPDWWDDRMLSRLPHALCGSHGGQVVR